MTGQIDTEHYFTADPPVRVMIPLLGAELAAEVTRIPLASR
jgi:hypothetical protein